MTQGKVFVADKTLSGPQGDGTLPVCPPSYEEATAGSSPSHSYGYQGNGEMLTEFTWQDKNIRRIFIRKVYSILMIQLCVAVAVVALFSYCEPVKTYIQANPGWHWASYVVFCVTFISLSCCATLRRRFPWNLILLAIFLLQHQICYGHPGNHSSGLSLCHRFQLPDQALWDGSELIPSDPSTHLRYIKVTLHASSTYKDGKIKMCNLTGAECGSAGYNSEVAGSNPMVGRVMSPLAPERGP
uniref:Protein lifeguard 2 n=1 Tax=Paramormyrops kingsleyae TaxID=1676925 RepID=A0A3B3RY74_9TELE